MFWVLFGRILNETGRTFLFAYAKDRSSPDHEAANKELVSSLHLCHCSPHPCRHLTIIFFRFYIFTDIWRRVRRPYFVA